MACPNRLFVAKKPVFISSHSYLQKLKRRYGAKKAGFAGTLDPFASGTLIIAFGAYTKLFRFLKKAPKRYRATLWLGAHSKTLDIEGVDRVDPLPSLPIESIQATLKDHLGLFTYTPPIFSAKKLHGQRAYALARAGRSIALKPTTAHIKQITLQSYRHPFLTFEAVVSEGTYLRSLGASIADRLGCNGALSALYRIQEGCFAFENEKPLDPIDYLAPPFNRYDGDVHDLMQGKPIITHRLQTREPGYYYLLFDRYFAIIEVTNGGQTRYLLNKVERCLS